MCGVVLVRMTYINGILAELLAWRSQKFLRGHLSHICELHRWHTKESAGLAWGGGRDEHTIVNHRCSMHAVIAVDVDIS